MLTVTIPPVDLIGPSAGLVFLVIGMWWVTNKLKICEENHEKIAAQYMELTKCHYLLQGKVEGLQNQQLPLDVVADLKKLIDVLHKVEKAAGE